MNKLKYFSEYVTVHVILLCVNVLSKYMCMYIGTVIIGIHCLQTKKKLNDAIVFQKTRVFLHHVKLFKEKNKLYNIAQSTISIFVT